MRAPDFDEGQRLEELFGQERLEHFVSKHYLKLMSFGAGSAGPRVASQVRKLAGELQRGDVARLLQMHWRPRVMGAWFAVAADDEALSDAVHDSLETSLGHLTAPPLIIATLTYPTERTLGLLLDYARTDRDMGWGAAGFAIAAAGHLDNDAISRRPDLPRDRDDEQQLRQLLDFASKLRRT